MMFTARTGLFVFVFLFLRSGCAIINSGTTFGNGGAIGPRFISRGNIFKVVAGDTVELPCEIQNLGPFAIVWKRGNTLLTAGQTKITMDPRISLTGGFNLQVKDIRHSDQGDYTCQIGDGSQGDLIHTIEILMPPSIQIIPQSGQVTTKKGGPVSFECKANGNPMPIVQWSKKEGLLPSGLQVQSGYLLSINEVQRQDGGVFQCTASNGIGQPVSADVRLQVLYPPEVSVLRSWVNSGEGLEAKLDCIVHADPSPEVLWYQDSFLLQPTDRRTMSKSGNTYTLTIRNVQFSDYGNYSCAVQNSIGKGKRYMELSGKPGAAKVVSSQYSNPHDYDLQWVLQSVFPIVEVRILYRRMLINSSYHHPVFQCTASNGIGQPVSADVRLQVLYPPEVSVLRSWVNSGEGLEAKLDCIVHADPSPEVLWYQDSFLLQPTDRRTMSKSGNTYTLTIRNVQFSDYGNYSCAVQNSIGKGKRYMELSGKPGAAKVVSSQYSNPHDYDLQWVLQSVFPIVEVRILYRRMLINSSYHHPGQWHDLLVKPPQNYNSATGERTQTYTLTNLIPDSVYECLIQAKNQHGFGELSDLHQWFSSPRGSPLLRNHSTQIKPKRLYITLLTILIGLLIRC